MLKDRAIFDTISTRSPKAKSEKISLILDVADWPENFNRSFSSHSDPKSS